MEKQLSSFQILHRQIGNQRGDALLIAIAMSFVCLLSSLAMMKYSNMVEAATKRPRIKSMMAATEAKVREALISPASYTGCATGYAGTQASGRNSCSLVHSKVTGLSRIMPDVPCAPPATACGIAVTITSEPTPSNPPPTTSTFGIKIRYEGTDMNLRDVDFTMDVPADILQQTGVYKCPNDKPKFLGLNNKGQMECVGLTGSAGPGQFLNVVDMQNLTVVAHDLPGDVNCGTGNYIERFDLLNGGTDKTVTCKPRLDPFTTFGFTPTATSVTNNLD